GPGGGRERVSSGGVPRRPRAGAAQGPRAPGRGGHRFRRGRARRPCPAGREEETKGESMTVRVSLRVVGLALLTFTAGASSSRSAPASDDKKSAVPFYRKYLQPGNKLDDQIIEQEQRIAGAPNDASLHNDMGNLLAARHFAHEAAQEYELAAKLDKTNFIALYNLGLLRETEGKFSQPTSAYQKSVARKHGFPPAHFRLGRMYEKAERNDEAIAEYATALRIDPSMRDPRRNPLVVDSELIYRASLANYDRDVASA